MKMKMKMKKKKKKKKKKNPSRIFAKFEWHEGSLKCHFVCVLLGFSQNFWAIPIMNHYRGSWYV